MIKDTVISILFDISNNEIKNNQYDTYVKICGNNRFFTWVAKTNKTNVSRIEKIELKTKVPLAEGGNNTISVTDFDIHLLNNPNHIAIRIINEYDLQFLKMDNTKISKVAESILAGLGEALAKMDSLRQVCI